jgi:hypothetical protein
MSILDVFKKNSNDATRAELLARYAKLIERDKLTADELLDADNLRRVLELDGTLQQDILRVREAHRLADALKGADKRRAAMDKAETAYRAQVRATQEAIESARAKLDDARQAFLTACDTAITDYNATDRASMLGGEVVGPIADRLKLPRTAPDLSDLPRDPAEVIAEVEPGHGEPRTVNQNLATALAGIA